LLLRVAHDAANGRDLQLRERNGRQQNGEPAEREDSAPVQSFGKRAPHHATLTQTPVRRHRAA
jgi:hypothetical protein